jgi:hypothetical protein
MSAMTASRSNGKLGTFYNKLVESGKKKMVALIAVIFNPKDICKNVIMSNKNAII